MLNSDYYIQNQGSNKLMVPTTWFKVIWLYPDWGHLENWAAANNSFQQGQLTGCTIILLMFIIKSICSKGRKSCLCFNTIH